MYLWVEGKGLVSYFLPSYCRDDKVCVLCRSGNMFSFCCKSKHIAQNELAEKKHTRLLYCVDTVSPKDPTIPCVLSISDEYKLTFNFRGVGEYTEMARRIANSPQFTVCTEGLYVYLGVVPVTMPTIEGKVSFGTVTLSKNDGYILLVATAGSRNQAEGLLYSLQSLAQAEPVVLLDRSLLSRTSVSGKFDKETSKRDLSIFKALVTSLTGAAPHTMSLAKSSMLKAAATAVTDQRTCAYCNARRSGSELLAQGPMKLCGGCEAVKYCNRECQTKHWKQHKSFCEPVSKLASVTSSSPCGNRNIDVGPLSQREDEEDEGVA